MYVYSFDIRIGGKSGVEEIMVDADNGKVICRKHESAKEETAEQANDRADAKKTG